MLSCNGEPHVVEAQMDNDGWLNGFRVKALSSKKKEGSFLSLPDRNGNTTST